MWCLASHIHYYRVGSNRLKYSKRKKIQNPLFVNNSSQTKSKFNFVSTIYLKSCTFNRMSNTHKKNTLCAMLVFQFNFYNSLGIVWIVMRFRVDRFPPPSRGKNQRPNWSPPDSADHYWSPCRFADRDKPGCKVVALTETIWELIAFSGKQSSLK